LKAASFVMSISSPRPRKSMPVIWLATAASIICRRFQEGQQRVEKEIFIPETLISASPMFNSGARHLRICTTAPPA